MPISLFLLVSIVSEERVVSYSVFQLSFIGKYSDIFLRLNFCRGGGLFSTRRVFHGNEGLRGNFLRGFLHLRKGDFLALVEKASQTIRKTGIKEYIEIE